MTVVNHGNTSFAVAIDSSGAHVPITEGATPSELAYLRARAADIARSYGKTTLSSTYQVAGSEPYFMIRVSSLTTTVPVKKTELRVAQGGWVELLAVPQQLETYSNPSSDLMANMGEHYVGWNSYGTTFYVVLNGVYWIVTGGAGVSGA